MKKCVNCNIHVGGNGSQCPICQSRLTGEGGHYNWPPMKKLRLQSFVYKLQLFLVLAFSFVSLALDFLLGLHAIKHWSIPVVLWALTGEMLLRHFVKKSVVVAAILTDNVVHVILMLIFTGWYMGFLNPIIDLVVPLIVSGLLIANLVLSLIDKYGNAMIYLLINIAAGIIPYVFIYIIKKDAPLSWTICLMLSVVTFIAICVFKGRSVRMEIQKRFSI